ncbi:MAG: CPBP family intramembrane glutamic endopeptidase [Patescibacteria group bacterium]
MESEPKLAQQNQVHGEKNPKHVVGASDMQRALMEISTPNLNVSTRSMTRRTFLSGAATTSLLAGMGTFNPPVAGEEEFLRSKQPKDSIVKAYGETIAQATLVAFSNMIGVFIMNTLLASRNALSDSKKEESEGTSTRVGAAGKKEMIKMLFENPGALTTLAVIIAPTVEEIGFRLLPSLVVDRALGSDAGVLWEVGVPTSILFAQAHTKEGGRIETLPLPQFIAGMFCWYLQRERGFSHALTAHAFNNAIVLGIMMAGKHFVSPEEIESVRRTLNDEE